MFKDKISISSSGIVWQNRCFPLEKISRVRWGATRHSVNGVPTGTNRMILVGDDQTSMTISLRSEMIYDNIVQRLWKAVGIRLATEHVERLKAIGSLPIPGGSLRDEGVILTRRKIFGSNETVALEWKNVTVWHEDGNFCIGKHSDRRFHSALSYQNHDNTYVIERLIEVFSKSAKSKLSELFD